MKTPKKLYYFCPNCHENWDDAYNPQYGHCDDECPSCGKKYSPFINSKSQKSAISKNELLMKKEYLIVSSSDGDSQETLQLVKGNQLETKKQNLINQRKDFAVYSIKKIN